MPTRSEKVTALSDQECDRGSIRLTRNFDVIHGQHRIAFILKMFSRDVIESFERGVNAP